MSLGACYLGEGRTSFRVWAPRARSVEVRVVAPWKHQFPLTPESRAYFSGAMEGIEPGGREN